MTTFKEFLSEKITHAIGQDLASAEEVIKLLNKNCSEIVSIYKSRKNKFLYRGIMSEKSRDKWTGDTHDADFIFGKSREDRKTVDIDKSDHEVLHNAFLKLGLKATRKNSIFTVTDKGEAEDWGKIYIIFPFSNTEITWFNLSQLRTEYTYYKIQDILSDHFSSKRHKDYKDNIAADIKKKIKPEKDDLASALIPKRAEVLVNGQYYGISINSDLWKKHIKPWLIN